MLQNYNYCKKFKLYKDKLRQDFLCISCCMSFTIGYAMQACGQGRSQGGASGDNPRGPAYHRGPQHFKSFKSKKKFNILALLVPEILIFIGEKLVIFSILQNQY